MSFRSRSLVAIVLALVVCLATQASPSSARRLDLPPRLSDQDFWQLVTELSEPNGFFNSDNLVSNEDHYQDVIPELVRLVKPGGVYVGVGPDQNFTYIAALEPRMAFIPDVRRGNLLEQLLYKAVVELSPDRAAFVSRLFSKPRPAGLRRDASVDEIFAAYAAIGTREDLFRQNLRAVKDLLTRRHGFRLSPDDTAQLEDIYMAFFWDGPALRYSMPGMGVRGRMMKTQIDVSSDGRIVLVTQNRGEAAARWVQQLQGKRVLSLVESETTGAEDE